MYPNPPVIKIICLSLIYLSRFSYQTTVLIFLKFRHFLMKIKPSFLPKYNGFLDCGMNKKLVAESRLSHNYSSLLASGLIEFIEEEINSTQIQAVTAHLVDQHIFLSCIFDNGGFWQEGVGVSTNN